MSVVVLAFQKGRGSMRRPAFTVIEMMVVVMIVVAVSAVVLPALAGRVTAGKMGMAVQALDMATASTRSQAMLDSRMYALLAVHDKHAWVLVTQPVHQSDAVSMLGRLDRGDSGTAAGSEASDVSMPLGKEGETGLGIPDARSSTMPGFATEMIDTVDSTHWKELAHFDDEVSFTSQLPSVDSTGMSGEAMTMDKSTLSQSSPTGGTEAMRGAVAGRGIVPPEAAEEQPLLIGVYFPDGSCRSKRVLYLVGRDGARRSLHFGAISGRLEVRTLPSVAEESALGIDQYQADDPLLPMGAENASGVESNSGLKSPRGGQP